MRRSGRGCSGFIIEGGWREERPTAAPKQRLDHRMHRGPAPSTLPERATDNHRQKLERLDHRVPTAAPLQRLDHRMHRGPAPSTLPERGHRETPVW